MEELETAYDKAEQSRINGAKSRGPVSDAGKKRVARNARRHGLSSASEVCLDGEDAVAFNRLHEGLLNTFSPNCDDGFQLVRQMALSILQQERCARRETEIWGDRALDPVLRLRELGLILRYRNAAVRLHYRARRELMLVLERPHLGTSMLGKHAERIPMEGDAPLAAEHAAIVEADEAQRTAYIDAKVAEELGVPAKPANQSVAAPNEAASMAVTPIFAANQPGGKTARSAALVPSPSSGSPLVAKPCAAEPPEHAAPTAQPKPASAAIPDALIDHMALIAKLMAG